MVTLILTLFAARTAEAVRIVDPPCIDGILDEECWYQNPGITDFEEYYPDRGAEPSDSTRIVICYDDHYLYFGCFCYQDPDSVTARLVPRESSGDGDDVTISLDTYDDDRNAYRFSINPLGIQRDIHITERGSGFDYAWNGVWISEGSITVWGWSAEIAIPWKTLRFAPGVEQVWGLQVSRWVNCRNQTLMWADYQKDDRGTRIDRFGTLTGIEGVSSGFHMEFLPHLTQTLRFEDQDTLPQTNVFDSVSLVPLKNGVAGLDFKWGISSNLTLDVTTLPDYGQIEADPEYINLSKYETYLSERRPFFTEGSDLFDFGGYDPVYTRRIGRKLPDGTEVPIYAGAKLTGTLGSTEFGLIEAYTGRTSYFGGTYEVPPTLYSIARVKQGLYGGSEAGAIFTSVEQFADTIEGDRVAGVDLDLDIGERWYFSSEGLYSFHIDKKGGPMANLGFGRSGKFDFHLGAGYTDSLADLNAVGFLSRPGHMWASVSGGYDQSWGVGPVRSLYVNLGPSGGKELEDSLFSYTLWGYSGLTFSNNWSSSLSVSGSRNYYQEDSTLRWIGSVSTGFNTSHTRNVYGGLWFSARDQYVYQDGAPQYFGHVASASPSLSWRPGYNLLLSAYASIYGTFLESWEPDPGHAFRWTAGQSVRYTATRRLSFRLNAQQNTDAERYSQQFLAIWEIAPLSYLYLASSVNLTGDSETPPWFDVEVSEVTFYGKIVYLFRI